jgi:hypothetical protein
MIVPLPREKRRVVDDENSDGEGGTAGTPGVLSVNTDADEVSVDAA